MTNILSAQPSLLEKSPGAMRTIGEAAQELAVATHVLRFWEEKFVQIQPLKRNGRRYYRPEDMAALYTIKRLLYSEGYTIKGAQKYLEENAVDSSAETLSSLSAPAYTSSLLDDLHPADPADNDEEYHPHESHHQTAYSILLPLYRTQLQEVFEGLLEARKELQTVLMEPEAI